MGVNTVAVVSLGEEGSPDTHGSAGALQTLTECKEPARKDTRVSVPDTGSEARVSGRRRGLEVGVQRGQSFRVEILRGHCRPLSWALKKNENGQFCCFPPQ